MASRNQYPARGSLDGASDGFAVTPNDGVDLADVPRGLWVGGAGNIALTLASGNVVLKSVAAGSLLPVKPTRVLATGTTATDIVALL